MDPGRLDIVYLDDAVRFTRRARHTIEARLQPAVGEKLYVDRRNSSTARTARLREQLDYEIGRILHVLLLSHLTVRGLLDVDATADG
jgi:hypothetical protein